MPKVVIPRQELNAVDLPPVCVVTGATEGVSFHPVTYRKQSQWWLLAFAFCLVPGLGPLLLLASLVLSFVLTRKVTGALPFTELGARQAARGQLLRTVAYVATVAAAVAIPVAGVHWANESREWPFILSLAVFGACVVAIPVLGLTTSRRRVFLRDLSSTEVTLQIPSEAAASAIARRLNAWTPQLTDAWSTRPASGEQCCAHHGEVRATWICGRCGTFACDACLARLRPQSMPVCTSCFARRAS